MKRLWLLLFLVVIFRAHPLGYGHPDIDTIIAHMSLEEKIGQMFMVGGLGARKLMEGEMYRKYHFGNVFLGHLDLRGLSLKRITRLNRDLQVLAKKYNGGIPLLIATDQEGGKVNRLRAGFRIHPSQNTVGETMDYAGAEKAAAATAKQMRALGVNVNFSPVGDVNTNRQSHIAKLDRSFGPDPEKAANYSIAYLKGYAGEGVAGCLKHFPGYGDVSPDPHRLLPVTRKTMKELEYCELVPYIRSLNAGVVEMIMTAHIVVPALDDVKDLPATLSKKALAGYLRGKLGFNGVIVTDDFNMGAVGKSGMDAGEAAVRAVEAGVDMLLFVAHYPNQTGAWNALRSAVKKGRVPELRINESVKRILLLKRKYAS